MLLNPIFVAKFEFCPSIN